jgi:hypothetical protein
MQEKFKYYGGLGFKAETEVRIPKGEIDYVGNLKNQFQNISLRLNLKQPLQLSNCRKLSKSLSMPLQMRPRFLVQLIKVNLRI